MQPKDTGGVVVPVIAQELDVKAREVETGRVRVAREVREREEAVTAPRVRERVHVERVPINQVVAQAPRARLEGDTLILPVVEESLAVEKRLVLKEELRITKIRVVEAGPEQRAPLRSEEVRVDRVPTGAAAVERGARDARASRAKPQQQQ